jgi:hypothetical protein
LRLGQLKSGRAIIGLKKFAKFIKSTPATFTKIRSGLADAQKQITHTQN